MATLPAAIIYRITDPDENDAKTEHVSFLPKVFNDKTTKSVGPYVNEYVGTFLLTSVVSLAVATGKVAAPIAAGLMFMAMTFSGAYVSGTHVNPAVTAGLFFRKGGDRSKAVGYGVAQILGALMAAGLSHTALGSEVCKGKILPQLGQGVTEGQAMGAEMLFTGLLLQAVFSFGAQGTPTAVLAIAGTLMAGLAAAGGVSGGALNPAVATGLYLKNAAGNQINNLYIYWLGPMLGAVLVALVNKKIGEDESLGGKAQSDAQNRAQGAMNDAQAAFNNAMPQQ
jgi:aquaporin Z